MKTTIGEFFNAKVFRVFAMVLMLASVVFVSQNVFAQGTRGTIRGTVTDQNGAIVPNATVVLTDVQKGTKNTVQTNEDGVYQFLEVEPATYTVRISAANFADTLVNVKVEPNRNVIGDAILQVGQVENQVTVTAGAELIDRESPTLGSTVDNRRIIGLPLDGREVLDLALLQPGVVQSGGGFGSGSGIRVNGNRGVENNLTLDGANNNEVAVGGAIGQSPRPDAIQEFRILSSNFGADFGRNTGSVINVVTKPGGNEFHGNGRFFYRPTKLTAAEFFANADPLNQGNDVRRKFERKDYGGNIGGPIYFLNFGDSGGPVIYDGKDRSFFFVDYEKRYQDRGNSQRITSIPTAAERAGNFSTDPGRDCNGDGTLDGICDPATGLPFPGGMIPSSRFSPIAQYYLQFFPAATPTGSAVVNANELTKNNYLTMRFDHNVTENHIINFTFNYFDFDQDDPFAFGGSDFPGFPSADRRKTRNWVGRYTYVITPDIVNYFSLGIAKNKQPSVAPVNRTTPREIGFTADFVAAPQFAGPPQIRLFDRGLRIGNSIQGPQARVSENYQIQDSVNWVVGSHRLKFGVDATKYKQGQDFVFINQSFLTFSGRFGGNSTGDDFADFLIGNSPIAAQYGSAGRRDFRQTAFAGFAQDTWRATKRLTLTFGVRYEYTSPLKDLFDRVAYYRPGATSTLLRNGSLTFEGRRIVAANPNNLPVGLVFVGDPDPVLGGTVPRGGVAPDKNNWAPRFGFAYSFGETSGIFNKLLGNDQTVIRGGIGIYYGAIIGDNILQQLTAPGYNGTNAFFFPNGGTLADPFAPDPFPGFDGVQPQRQNPFTSTADIVIPSILAQFSTPIDPNLKTPQATQFNLTLARSFARDYVMEVSYVGNRGRKFYISEEINPAVGTLIPVPAGRTIPPPTTSNGNSRRLNNSIQRGLGLLTSAGDSNYDGLQVNLQKRASDDGLSFQIAYTFSKTINNGDTQRGGLDILDRRFGRGLSGDDKPHRFVGSFIYELPFFNDTTGVLNRLLDGWALNGIYAYQSGDLVSVGNPNDELGTGGGVISFADLGAPFQNVDTRATDGGAFNPGAFRSFRCDIGGNYYTAAGLPIGAPDCPNGPRRGTSGRNQFRLDNPVNNLDLALVKKTRLFSERSNLELRFEVFNIFNTAQFIGADTNLNSPDFGNYTDTREPRVIQLGIRLSF